MKFNGTKTRALALTLAVICALAPLSQTMAAGRRGSRSKSRSRKTTGYRNADRKNVKKCYPSKTKRRTRRRRMTDGEKAVAAIATIAFIGWMLSEGTKNTAPRRSYYSDAERRADQRRREELKRQRTINEMRTRRGY